MAFMVSTSANYHWTTKITASTLGDGALHLTLHGDPAATDGQFNQADITVFTEDAEMVAHLVEAINSVIVSHQQGEPQKLGSVMAIEECSKCKGSGEIACRTSDGSYMCAGPVPDYARGVFSAKCFECRGTGLVDEEEEV